MRSRSFTQAALLAALLAAPLGIAGCASARTPTRQLDDAAITADVKARFAADPEVQAHVIDVDTLDGTVTLTGNVASTEVRHEAVKLARHSAGVVAVRDNLRVASQPTIGEKIDDTGITTRIKSKLIDDPLVRARDIDVDTVEGVVTLTGIVRSSSERDRAAQIASATTGVRSVRNLLEVSTG